MKQSKILTYLKARHDEFVSLATTPTRALICVASAAPEIILTMDADGNFVVYFCDLNYQIRDAIVPNVAEDYGDLPPNTGVIEGIQGHAERRPMTVEEACIMLRNILKDMSGSSIQWHASPVELILNK